jgi:hypothetical protein
VSNLKINPRMLLTVIAGLLVLPMFAQSTHATSVDFLCGPSFPAPSGCNGNISAVFSSPTVLVSASDLGGITLLNDSGPVGDAGLNFSLIFDTTAAVPNIVVFEPGPDNSELQGTIVGFSGAVSKDGLSETVNLDVSWTSMPLDFAQFLGATAGSGFDDNIALTIDGSAQSVDVNIQPVVPEPATLLLFGSGLLGLGVLVRRKLNA